jgi:hypothetical protein
MSLSYGLPAVVRAKKPGFFGKAGLLNESRASDGRAGLLNCFGTYETDI